MDFDTILTQIRGAYHTNSEALTRFISKLMDEMKGIQRLQKRFKYLLTAGWLGTSGAAAALFLHPALNGKLSTTHTMYGGFVLIGAQIGLYYTFDRLKEHVSSHIQRRAARSVLVLGTTTLMGILLNHVAEQTAARPPAQASSHDNARINMVLAQTHDPIEIVMPTEDLTDPINYEPIRSGDIVYILDECQTSPITLQSLNNLSATRGEIKNPFTNLPLQTVKKVRIMQPTPTPPPAESPLPHNTSL